MHWLCPSPQREKETLHFKKWGIYKDVGVAGRLDVYNIVEESNESVCKHGSGSRSTRRGAKHANGLLKGWGWTSGEENFVN